MLFRLRFQDNDIKERQAFVEGLNLDWETVGEEEKFRYAEELKAAAGGFVKRIEEESFFKVDWERVPELVGERKVFLRGGKAFVPSREQMSMVVAEFTARLDKALEVCPHLLLIIKREKERNLS
jgi:DNA primase large subunit